MKYVIKILYNNYIKYAYYFEVVKDQTNFLYNFASIDYSLRWIVEDLEFALFFLFVSSTEIFSRFPSSFSQSPLVSRKIDR